MKNLKHYATLAELFRYPEQDFPQKVAECQLLLEKQYPDAASELSLFTDYINKCTVDEREELFTKTFDVQPICYLDLGYVIFGEDYKRGVFLLNMKREQAIAGNDCGTDLPDNLVHVLTLLSITQNYAFIDELSVKILIPGIEKMIAEFESARVALKLQVIKKMHKAIIQEDLNKGNVYQYCFKAMLAILKQDFAEAIVNNVETFAPDINHSFFKKTSTILSVNNSKN